MLVLGNIILEVLLQQIVVLQLIIAHKLLVGLQQVANLPGKLKIVGVLDGEAMVMFILLLDRTYVALLKKLLLALYKLL